MSASESQEAAAQDMSCLFVGAGRWGRNVIEAFVTCGTVPSGFVVSGSVTTLEWLAGRFPGVPVWTSFEAALDTDDSRTVVITTPRSTHVALAELALMRGRDVFVEKPLAMTSDDGWRLAELADSRGLALFTGFTYLYHPAYARLRAAVPPDDVAALHLTWNRPGLTGPVEWELLPHDVALAIALTGHAPPDITIAGGGVDAACRWTTHRGVAVRIGLHGAGSGPKQKKLQLTTRSGERWEWSDNRLLRVLDPNPSSPAGLVDEQFSPELPLLREAQWFLDHRADRAAMRADAALSVTVTDLITRALPIRQERLA